MNKFINILCITDDTILSDITLICNALFIDFFIENGLLFVDLHKSNFFLKNFNEYLNEEIGKTSENIDISANVKIELFSYCLIIFLITTFIFTRYNHFYHWVNIGGNDAYLLINGEFWRSITALTLHNGIIHIFSNLLFFSLLLKPLIHFLNEGKAWFFVFLSGAAGNILSDYIYQIDHVSIGFSTAVFGAVGILSVLNFYNKEETSFIRQFLPFGAGLGLFAFTGISKEVDVAAHFTGLLSGIIITLIYFKKINFLSKISDLTYKILTVSIIAISWFVAIC